jgi:hypothetical protein
LVADFLQISTYFARACWGTTQAADPVAAVPVAAAPIITIIGRDARGDDDGGSDDNGGGDDDDDGGGGGVGGGTTRAPSAPSLLA